MRYLIIHFSCWFSFCDSVLFADIVVVRCGGLVVVVCGRVGAAEQKREGDACGCCCCCGVVMMCGRALLRNKLFVLGDFIEAMATARGGNTARNTPQCIVWWLISSSPAARGRSTRTTCNQTQFTLPPGAQNADAVGVDNISQGAHHVDWRHMKERRT